VNRIAIRVPNWLGDSVMARPFVAALAATHGIRNLVAVAHPRVADLWLAWPELEVLTLPADAGRFRGGLKTVRELRRRGPFQCGYLMTASLSSALLFAAGGVRERVGFAGGGRSWLLADPVPRVPKVGVQHYSSEFFNLIHRVVEPDYAAPPDYAWPAAATVSVRERITGNGLQSHSYIVAAVGTAGAAKRYPVASWHQALAQVSARRPVVLVGTESERPLAAEAMPDSAGLVLNWCGQTSLPELAVLLGRAAGFVGCDSGAAHLAASSGCPTVALFGPGDEVETCPMGGSVRVLREPLWCAPCRSRRCYREDHPSECMTLLAPAVVARAILDLAESGSGVPDPPKECGTVDPRRRYRTGGIQHGGE
jgi:heptosyltransferase-2